jgi:hypothetical protein
MYGFLELSSAWPFYVFTGRGVAVWKPIGSDTTPENASVSSDEWH